MSTLTNLQPLESYTHSSYDASKNHLKELWFKCHSQGFSYAIFDGHLKQVEMYFNFEVADFYQVSPQTFHGFLDAIDVFINDFKSVKIIFESQTYTLMPAALFNEEDSAACYGLKYTLSENEHLLNQRIPDFGAQIIYAVPRFMLNALLSKFTDSSLREQVKIYHHAFALLSALYYQTYHLNKEVCYLNISEKTFDVVLIKNSSLHFCNTYVYNNPEDVLYFVMHAYQNSQLQPEANECFYSGFHTNEKNIRELLNSYIKSVKTIQLCQMPSVVVNPSTLFLLQHCA